MRHTQKDVLDGFRHANLPDLTKRLLAQTAATYGENRADELVVRAIREAVHGDHTQLWGSRDTFYGFLWRVIRRIA